MSTFTDRLNKLMAERDVTAYRLASAIGISEANISRWRNKGQNPSYASAHKIAEYFHVDVEYLLGKTDKEREYDPNLDEDLVTALRSLNPQQIQRVKDFVSGLKG
jgi:transcriptional regulator with XRE-family HTH domain